MKMLSFVLIALVGTMILNIPIQSFADPQLDTLLRIATQARDNLSITISQINNVPDEIAKLYNQGSAETDNLAKAVDQHDDTSAKQHFLSAMQFFKTTNDKINSLNATAPTDQQRADVLRLQSEITRMDSIGKRLKTIAINNHVDIDFTTLDQFVQTARQDLDAGNIEDASKAIQSANQFVIDAHHSLATVAKQRTSDRAKDFTEKQIERFNNQNITSITPLPPASIQNSTNATQENPQEMVSKLRKLISEGKVDEAIKVIKSLEAYQKENIKINEGSTQSSDKTSGNVSNNTKEVNNRPPANPSTNETITNSTTVNSPMVTNSTQISITVNSVNQSGNPITGMWTVLRYANGTTITSGFTPVTFTATSGIQYVVHVGNYQNAVFNHWNDGNTSNYKTITPTQNVTLTAYYSTGTTAPITPSAKQNLQSTSGNNASSNATEIGNGTVTNKTKSSQGTSAVTVGSGQEDNVKKNFDKNQRVDFKKGKGRQNSDNQDKIIISYDSVQN